jgi:transposase
MEIGGMKRHELTDDQWDSVKTLLPERVARTGRKPRDARQMLNGILWVLRTGAPWRDLPERFGPWKTVYHYFCRWRDDGTFEHVLEALQIRLDRQGQIDWDLWCIDGSSVRASRASAGATKKVSSNTATNPQTTHWAAQRADSAANSTWLLTVQACRSRSK